MQWVSENWGLLLVGGGMVAMHLFGYRRPVRGRNPRLNRSSWHSTHGRQHKRTIR